MKDERIGGVALVVPALLGILVMGLHPTGHELASAGHDLAAKSAVGVGVHALAIASMPLAFLGALALSGRLHLPSRLAVAALVVYGFALAAEMIAATLSGLVGTGLVGGLGAADQAEAAVLGPLAHYNGRLNQAFAQVYVVASSASILLWSVSIVATRALAVGIGIYGLVLAPITVLAVTSGHVRLDVHGFGLIVLAQTAWFVAAGISLWRSAAR